MKNEVRMENSEEDDSVYVVRQQGRINSNVLNFYEMMCVEEEQDKNFVILMKQLRKDNNNLQLKTRLDD